MDAKERIKQLVTAIGGDPATVYTDYNGSYKYHEAHGKLDIRITNSDSFKWPWVDLFHFGDGSVALFQVRDGGIAAELIERYKEIYREAPDAH